MTKAVSWRASLPERKHQHQEVVMTSGAADRAAEADEKPFEPACRVVLVEGRSRQHLARKVDELIAPYEADQIVSVSFTAATSLFMWSIVYSAFVILRVEEGE